MSTTTILPISRATMYLQPDGTYSETSTGVAGETAVTVPVTDLVLMDDLDPGGAETTSDLQAYSQDCYHVIAEALGSNLADPTAGADADGLLSASDDKVAAWGSTVDRQIELDPRTESCSSMSTKDPATGEWSSTITIVPKGTLLPIVFAWSRLTGLHKVLA